MRKEISVAAALGVFLLSGPVSLASLADYQQDFEDLDASGPQVGDGWRYFVNVFESTDYLFGYGNPAPNGPQISALVTGHGGPGQGNQQLSVYSDYECCAGGGPAGSPSGHQSANGLVETNVFQEQMIGSEDEGSTWTFSWDAARGNIDGSSEAIAFIKVLDPTSGFATTAIASADMTSTPDIWTSYALNLEIGDWEGFILQFGFLTLASNFEGSGNFYDNVSFTAVPIPAALLLMGSGLLGLAGFGTKRRRASS